MRVMSFFAGVLGIDDQSRSAFETDMFCHFFQRALATDQGDVQKFCCAQPAQDRVYSAPFSGFWLQQETISAAPAIFKFEAVSKAEAGQEQLESDDEPTRQVSHVVSVQRTQC